MVITFTVPSNQTRSRGQIHTQFLVKVVKSMTHFHTKTAQKPHHLMSHTQLTETNQNLTSSSCINTWSNTEQSNENEGNDHYEKDK